MDNRRLILLLMFGLSLFMLWDAWQKFTHPQPVTTDVTAAAASRSGNSAPAAGAAGAVATPVAPATAGTVPAAANAASNLPFVTVKTDLYIARISARGGDLERLELVTHHATEDKTKNFVLFDNGEKHVYLAQSGLTGEGNTNHNTVYTLPTAPAELKEGANEVVLRLEAPATNGLKVSKTYTFHRGSYLIDVDQEIVNQGSAPVAPYVYFRTVRDGKAPEDSSGGLGASTYTGPAVYTEEAKFQKAAFEDITKGKAKFAAKADNGWVAMIQHYFVSAWLLPGKSEREFLISDLGSGLYSAGLRLPVAAIAPGASVKVPVQLYAGPQEQDKLSKIAPGLELVVDYGWLTVIAAPLFWVLELIQKFTGNWGWSIIGLTVLIKAVFFPLSAASYKSMAKMKLMAPKLQKLKETFGDDKARLNQEMMDLYKREKINPLGGCLPILVQIPVFIALYWVLGGVVEMRGAPWLGWITDLSDKDPYYVLPLIMGATMFLQTKLNPAPADPIQAKVMLAMPIVFTAMFFMFPSGLVLYWTVNNLLSIAQQWQINKMIEAGGGKS
ncbi:MAG: membrane protein insertase YidC [Rhodocyclaceae bacterium]|nr:membrane protein insertase YidC [Rhodocyclaceae bacterium]